MGSQSKLNIRRVSTAKKIILHIKSAIMFLKSFILFTLIISFTTSIPAPLDDMEIYTQCKAQFGTTQNVECRSSQDCSINSSSNVLNMIVCQEDREEASAHGKFTKIILSFHIFVLFDFL